METVEFATNKYSIAMQNKIKAMELDRTQYIYCIDCGKELNEVRKARFCSRCIECQKIVEDS